MQGRGLKLLSMRALAQQCLSPLMQGRGLKHLPMQVGRLRDTSPLMQGRGLKLLGPRGRARRGHVAPHAGAWIETCRPSNC